YKIRKHLDGNYYFVSSTLFYLPKSTQFWFAGMDFHRENTQALDNAYQQKTLRLGWGQDWFYGISSRFTFSYANRVYREKDLIGIQQKNREYTTTITLWHRNIHFMGLTPKLSWDYQKSTSNHAFYRYDKNRIYLEIGKIF
ncbi:surface lipoprotein assembly modifier, partial [Haemophilus influenzae]